MADKVDNPNVKTELLKTLEDYAHSYNFFALAKIGELEVARSVIDKIEEPKIRDEALEALEAFEKK